MNHPGMHKDTQRLQYSWREKEGSIKVDEKVRLEIFPHFLKYLKEILIHHPFTSLFTQNTKSKNY